MALTDIGIFDLAQKRLAWLSQRHTLLAQNVANADTPHFQPRDLVPFAATLSRSAAAAQPVRTNPMHLAGSQDNGLATDNTILPEQRAPDGNAVSLEQELTKVAETVDAHQLVTNLYSAYFGMFRTVIGR